MNVHSQSGVDPTVAPPGKHTLSIFAQYYPYKLAEGTWDERRDEIAKHTLERFADYAPGFQGELVPEQSFDMRPIPGSKTYEGPVRGLYLCGSGAWPGGCVMGAPGHNAAHEAIGNLRAGRHA
jgi:phytoene dehydrogenase-like protein